MTLHWQAKDGTLVDPPITYKDMTQALRRGETPTDDFIAVLEMAAKEALGVRASARADRYRGEGP